MPSARRRRRRSGGGDRRPVSASGVGVAETNATFGLRRPERRERRSRRRRFGRLLRRRESRRSHPDRGGSRCTSERRRPFERRRRRQGIRRRPERRRGGRPQPRGGAASEATTAAVYTSSFILQADVGEGRDDERITIPPPPEFGVAEVLYRGAEWTTPAAGSLGEFRRRHAHGAFAVPVVFSSPEGGRSAFRSYLPLPPLPTPTLMTPTKEQSMPIVIPAVLSEENGRRKTEAEIRSGGEGRRKKSRVSAPSRRQRGRPGRRRERSSRRSSAGNPVRVAVERPRNGDVFSRCDSMGRTRPRKRKRIVAAAAIVLLASIVAAAGIAVGLTTGRRRVSDNSDIAPSPLWIRSRRKARLLDRFRGVLSSPHPRTRGLTASSSDASLSDPSSPQSRALEWLATKVEYAPSLWSDMDFSGVGGNDGTEAEAAGERGALLQRYAVATLFFSAGTGDGNWTKLRLERFFLPPSKFWWHEPVASGDDYEYLGSNCSLHGKWVMDIYLPSNNLVGTIPEEIAFIR
uniref:Uncharacterized protein n=1 Tax=Odontella aurita TaxID=265563 RepID=A0A7S4MLB3_9STRA